MEVAGTGASVEAIPLPEDSEGPPAAEPQWRPLAALPEARRWCHLVPIHFAAADLAAVQKPASSKKKR